MADRRKDELDVTVPPTLTPHMQVQLLAKASELEPLALVAGFEPEHGYLWLLTVTKRGVTQWSVSGPLSTENVDEVIKPYAERYAVARIRLRRQPPDEHHQTTSKVH